MRFAMLAAAFGAAFLSVPAQGAPIVYGFVANGTMTEFYHWTSLPNIYQTLKSGTITINPAPGASTFSSVTTDIFGYTTTTITGAIVGDVLTLSYNQFFLMGPTRERTQYGLTATFQAGTLQGGFPTFVDFATVIGGTVSYHYVICGPNCDGGDFSGSLTALQAVPEPATWAMMVLGFGAMGAALRRRRARVRFA